MNNLRRAFTKGFSTLFEKQGFETERFFGSKFGIQSEVFVPL